MNRLHIPRAELGGASTTVSGEALSYVRDVLRLRPGSPIEVFDGEGGAYPSVLARFVEGGAEIELGPREERPFQGVRITLLQGLPKGDKFELVVQKAVELGAMAVVPVACERSIVKLDAKKAVERVARWQKIADEAARQCLRADVATVEPLVTLAQHLAKPAVEHEKRFVLDEEEKHTRLRDVLTEGDSSFQLLVGPEGGLTREEVASARAAGFVPVTLGPRILRTETAGLAALAIIQSRLGDLG